MNKLQPYRDQIDALDSQIVELLTRRFEIIRDVAALKAREGIPAVIEERIRAVLDRAAQNAGPQNADLVRELYTLLVTLSCDLEEQIMARETAA